MKGFFTLAFVLSLLVALPVMAQDYKRGQVAYHGGNFTTALREWRPLAEQGYARSQYSVGVLYDRGQGVPQNYTKAAKWYRLAAEQGYSGAQYNLAQMIRLGQGVSQNYAKAAKWYRLAAAKGDADAQYQLDLMLKKGRSAPKKAAPATDRGDFRVQLSAFNSEARAVKEAERLARVHKSALGNLKITVVRADLGKRGTFYRLHARPLTGRAAAAAVCRKFSARKQACTVIKPLVSATGMMGKASPFLPAPAVAQDQSPSTVSVTDINTSAVVDAEPKPGVTPLYQSNRNGLPAPISDIRPEANVNDPEVFSIDPMEDCDNSTNCRWPHDIENDENAMKGHK